MPTPGLSERLLEAERRNLGLYGFGIKGFTLSMIETAIEVTEGRVPGAVIARDPRRSAARCLPIRSRRCRMRGRRWRRSPADYRLVLITKGDLFDQERKLAESGLGELSTRSRSSATRTPRPTSASSPAMATGRAQHDGRQLAQSDVVPAIEAGSWGVYVPHELTWALEHAEAPRQAPRFRQIAHLGELLPLVGEIGRQAHVR